jgi:hypothetical protein
MVKSTTTKIGLAIRLADCFYETSVQGSTVGILVNFRTKNAPYRQVENR